jgi:hypothetical protein
MESSAQLACHCRRGLVINIAGTASICIKHRKIHHGVTESTENYINRKPMNYYIFLDLSALCGFVVKLAVSLPAGRRQ